MFGDIGKMMKMLGQVKTRLPEIQAHLDSSEFSADAGQGTVTVTVNGKMRIVDVKIDPASLADGLIDADALGDMVKSAAASAQGQAAEAARAAMAEITGGIDLPPGLDSMLD